MTPVESGALQPQRREFGHLVLGKALSAGLGLVVLGLWWRILSPMAYGHYLVLLALLEIVAMVSALGLSTLTQRHLPVWIAHARRARHALAIVLTLLSLRAGLAVGAAVLMWWAASAWMPDAVNQIGAPWWLAWIMLGTLIRGLEEVQSSLLMQVWLQASTLVAHLLRLLAIGLFPPARPQLAEASAAGAPSTELQWLIGVEVAIALAVSAAGIASVVYTLNRRVPGADPMALEPARPWASAWRTSLGFWAIQCLGLTWSLHSLRLVAQALAGPSVLAVHAAAQALIDACRQASPVVWMGPWLRASMLRLQALESTGHSAWNLANSLERGSAVLMWPTLAVWCVEPDRWLRAIAGPALFAEAQRLSALQPALPPLTALLVTSAVLLPLQNRHLVLTLWSQIRQRWGWGLGAAVAASFWPAALVPLWPLVGLWSLPLVMVAAELTWVGLVTWAWRLDMGTRAEREDSLGASSSWGSVWPVALAALAAATACGGLLDMLGLLVDGYPNAIKAPVWARLALPWLSAAAAVALVIRMRPLWSSAEQAVLSACLPRSLSVMWRPMGSGAGS